jgi:regulator of protease activity HflC (stomatin/prohibitin superfamily)
MFPIILILLILLVSAIRVVNEYERGVIFRLGRLVGAKGPGLFFIIPIIDKMTKISLRTVVLDVPVQEVITKDNVPVSVNAVCYFRVMDPSKSVVEVQNYVMATSQVSQTTLRSVVGEVELDEVLSEREKINSKLQHIIDAATDPWGIKVSRVEIKDVQLPEQMQRSIAAQAEAERDRRAKIINAEGEFQAAEKIAAAAEIISTNPVGIQLRFLRTLSEIATENNSTTILPVPIDLFKAFTEGKSKGKNLEK